jgi:hypothetical protein
MDIRNQLDFGVNSKTMKPGDIVTVVSSSANPESIRCRVYDITRNQASEHNRALIKSRDPSTEFNSLQMITQHVIDKLHHGELATVLSPPIKDIDNRILVNILTPRGIIGWINSSNIKVIHETR